MMTVLQLIVVMLLLANVSRVHAQTFTTLELTTEARGNILKVLPDQSLRAVSNSKDLLYLFNSSGKLTRAVDLSQNRPFGIRYGDFDLCVNAQGDIFVLSVWRDESFKSGFFVYDNQGEYRYSVLLEKPVVSRRILVDSKGNLIVAGLNSDRYFNQSEPLFLLHKYRPDGSHVRSFLELDPNSYDPRGDIQRVYRVLYPLVDKAAIGICPRGVFAVVPGTRRVNFYHPDTLELTEVVELQAPSVSLLGVSPSMTDEYGQLNDTSLNIWALQVTDTEIEAEFLQSQQYGTPTRARRNVVISCRYDPSGNLLDENWVRVRETGKLILPTGTTDYSGFVKLGKREGQLAVIRNDLSPNLDSVKK